MPASDHDQNLPVIIVLTNRHEPGEVNGVVFNFMINVCDIIWIGAPQVTAIACDPVFSLQQTVNIDDRTLVNSGA